VVVQFRVCCEPNSITDPFQDDLELAALRAKNSLRSNSWALGRCASFGSSKELLSAIASGSQQTLGTA